MKVHAEIACQDLVLFADGSLSPPQQGVVAAHLLVCPECRAQVSGWQAMVTALRAAPPAPVEDSDLRAAVNAAIDAPPRARRWVAVLLRPVVWAAVPAAAAALVMMAVLPLHQTDPAWRSKTAGVSDSVRLTGVQIYRVGVLQQLESVTTGLAADDAMVLSYVNGSAAPFPYLTVFALDARGAVHWYYPAYENDGAKPQSIPIIGMRDAHSLPEQIRHPLAPGALQLHALFSRRPLTVQQVEAALGRGSLESLIADGIHQMLQVEVH